jgi:hypothetical protein
MAHRDQRTLGIGPPCFNRAAGSRLFQMASSEMRMRKRDEESRTGVTSLLGHKQTSPPAL